MAQGSRVRIGQDPMRASYIVEQSRNVQAMKERARFVSKRCRDKRRMPRMEHAQMSGLVSWTRSWYNGLDCRLLLEPDEEVSSIPNLTRIIQESVA